MKNLLRNPWFYGAMVIYTGFLVMWILGVIYCTEPLPSNFYCVPETCKNDDDGGIATNTWGPCGSGYSGSNSHCTHYCGNANGIVCAQLYFSCKTGDFTGGYYCDDASFQCLDPTALTFVIVGSVFFGLMTIFFCILYFCSRTPKNTAADTTTAEYEDVGDAEGIESDVPISRNDKEDDGDPEAIASDIPIRNTPQVNMESNPVVELEE